MFGLDDLIGGFGGALFGALGESAAAAKRYQAVQAMDEYLQQARGQKSLDPGAALAFLGLTDKSAYGDMDPRGKEASMEALAQLIKRGSGSGLDTQSRVGLQQAMGQSGAAARAARQAVMQEYQQRGTGGSSAELASALQGNQQGYGDLANATGQAAAASEQRRLEANVLASRAGQQQQQLEQQQAAAMDALRRFNVGARQNVLQQQIDAMRNLWSGYQGKGAILMDQAPQAAAGWANMGANVIGGLGSAYKGISSGNTGSKGTDIGATPYDQGWNNYSGPGFSPTYNPWQNREDI